MTIETWPSFSTAEAVSALDRARERYEAALAELATPAAKKQHSADDLQAKRGEALAAFNETVSLYEADASSVIVAAERELGGLQDPEPLHALAAGDLERALRLREFVADDAGRLLIDRFCDAAERAVQGGDRVLAAVYFRELQYLSEQIEAGKREATPDEAQRITTIKAVALDTFTDPRLRARRAQVERQLAQARETAEYVAITRSKVVA